MVSCPYAFRLPPDSRRTPYIIPVAPVSVKHKYKLPYLIIVALLYVVIAYYLVHLLFI